MMSRMASTTIRKAVLFFALVPSAAVGSGIVAGALSHPRERPRATPLELNASDRYGDRTPFTFTPYFGLSPKHRSSG